MASSVALWRIAKHTPDYRADDLSGGGAKKVGGRWNGKGRAVVYASRSIALATLETLAHLGDDIAIRNAFLVRIDVPQAVWRRREYIASEDLDPTWRAEPPGMSTIEFGNAWLADCSAALLEVPSVLVPEECNVLINPAHPDAKRLVAAVLRQFIYDPRL
ncbi:RES family NAD+ phosphorylase [Noviherbaspirillum pedocola]|uniref:RES family NAD+ phosphorylase n=1 Tax=Noviherbaspirillum pedocola TaxID=2801341 RepID=A0A934T0U9_9BURK|nr:RES family NAD+ phosphorylase [Noviherbaspirillum pedocola]MBK4736757.1 RES family NAD+ phosphorylase [Noviherbaspirillum pedocola]